MPPLVIGNYLFSSAQPCLIIAEAGVNHNGQLELAQRLVDAAAQAGANAVKFQTFRAETLVTRSVSRAPYQERAGTSAQFEMLKSLELSYEYHQSLKSHCDKRGIEFMSTAYDEEAALFLKELGVRRIKIASADIVNRPLLEVVAQTGLPVIQSTGMANLSEVERAVRLLQAGGTEDITLLHCVTSYPLAVDQVNMRWMATLRQAFQLPVGYSDHTIGIEIPLMAVSLGAVIIEKHLTLDRTLEGPDHSASLEPEEFQRMVQAIRNVEQAFGEAPFGQAPQEIENVLPMRRSLHAAKSIKAGQVIQREDLAVLRPYVGLDPWLIDLVIGRRSRANIDQEEPITWEDI
jgi:N-acetylneuraminate synthase